MKTNSKLKYFLIFGLGLSICAAFAHDVPVHLAITIKAAESALNNSPAYASFLEVVSSDLPSSGNLSGTNFLVLGSGLEDNLVPPQDAGHYRSLNHFYDPLDATYGKGLSDSPGFSGLLPTGDKRESVGTNSFAWGSVSNCMGINFSGVTLFGVGKNVNTSNTWSWPNARYYEWLGLTATDRNDRFNYLTNMFRAVGQVMHLVEDLSQPQHVRNEQHVDPFVANSWKEQHDPWASPIEVYGRQNVTNLNYGDGSMLDWRGAGFTKLEDFWDRHLYNGSAAALTAAENGGAQLGLAEWCNGNFLGDRHSYAEYFPARNSDGTPDIMWYPYPSLFTSTPYLQHGAFVDSVKLKNGQWRNRYYLPKTGDGIQVNHFSTVSWFGAEFPNKIFSVATSIRDDNVLKDYHDAFIPKAVQYSAGLVDYFFRGTMDVSVSVDANTNYTFGITNISSQDFSGGSFYLFQDDTNGNRTLAQQYDLSVIVSGGILPTNSSVSITYPGVSTPSGSTFLIVYKGTIGLTGGSPSDPVDANIGITATRPAVEQTIDYGDYQIPVPNPYPVPGPAELTTNLVSNDFPFPLTSGNYEVTVNYANFDDAGTIGSLSSASGEVASCTLPSTITSSVVPIGDISIAPDGKSLSVNVTATDDPVCARYIGWWTITITWRAWPASP